jgi:hypothetical protein
VRLGFCEQEKREEDQREEEQTRKGHVNVPDHPGGGGGVDLGRGWEKRHAQGKDATQVPGNAINAIITPVGEQEEANRPEGANQHIARPCVVIVAYGGLDAGSKDQKCTQRHREGETDAQEPNGFPECQIRDDKAFFGFVFFFYGMPAFPGMRESVSYVPQATIGSPTQDQILASATIPVLGGRI